MTILVLTVGTTITTIIFNKMIQSIKEYREAVARAEAREARRQATLALRKKLNAMG